jgi:hypothetical protein
MPRASRPKAEAKEQTSNVEGRKDFHFAGSSEAKVSAPKPGIKVEEKVLEPDIVPAMDRFNPDKMAEAKSKAAAASEASLKESFGVGRKPQLVDPSPNSQLANRNVFYVR